MENMKTTIASQSSDASARNMRVRHLSERVIALALVIEYAESQCVSFALMGFYDDDIEFLHDLAKRLGVPYNRPFMNKLRRVVRRLVNCGLLSSRMVGTAKDYIDEPSKQMEYMMNPGKAALIRRERIPGVTMGADGEAEYLLRHAYPAPQDADGEVIPL